MATEKLQNTIVEKPWFVPSQSLIQDAYDADHEHAPLDLHELMKRLEEIGIMNFHYVFYNGGLSGVSGIRDHLQVYPDGFLVQCIRRCIDVRVSSGDYSRETLERMYGLKQ